VGPRGGGEEKNIPSNSCHYFNFQKYLKCVIYLRSRLHETAAEICFNVGPRFIKQQDNSFV